MDTLESRKGANWSPTLRARSTSPFYSRSYGGFSKEQEHFFRHFIGTLRDFTVMDPMAGQGFALSQISWLGPRVYLGDVDPAPLLLASLRDPQILQRAETLSEWVRAKLRHLKKPDVTGELKYFNGWIPESIREQLTDYRQLFNLDQMGDPLSQDSRFWDAPIEMRFAAALPVLAARNLAVFTRSDNVTWLKNGGLQREQQISDPIIRALGEWVTYARSNSLGNPGMAEATSPLRVCWMDAEKGLFGTASSPTIIVTSPPYANRLDYTRMWAPELEVASAIFSSINPAQLRVSQIGSNSVRGKEVPEHEEDRLPETVRHALDQIRQDKSRRAAEIYYYRFFVYYAIALARTLHNLANFLQPGGRIIIFVRDTVTKDVLFPTGKLVEGTLCSVGGIHKTAEERHIIRHHVGLMRRNRGTNLYGLAQQEWWMVFDKEPL